MKAKKDKWQCGASTREELVDIILQSTEGCAGKTDYLRIDSKDLEFIICKTRRGNAVALVWGKHGTELTPKILLKIKEEAEALGLLMPVFIYATVNGGPNGISWYTFCQIPGLS